MGLNKGKTIILASASPRRREILARTGLEFAIIPGDYEERLSPGADPVQLAQALSRGKAESVARGRSGAIVIGADTFIVFGSELLGKPHTREQAVAMLERLSGRMHSVITGFTIIDTDTGGSVSEAVETRVWLRKLGRNDIDDYASSEEPLDKAGAYAIQGAGAALIERIDGDYLNVVGLPLKAVCEGLRHFGIETEPIEY